MAVPDFQSFMLPMLRIAADGREHSLSSLRDRLQMDMNLASQDLAERLPSGTQSRYSNRVAWSSAYLTKAGALKRIQRGVVAITDRGKELLAETTPVSRSPYWIVNQNSALSVSVRRDLWKRETRHPPRTTIPCRLRKNSSRAAISNCVNRSRVRFSTQ